MELNENLNEVIRYSNEFTLSLIHIFHDHKIFYKPGFIKQNIIFFIYRVLRKALNFNQRFLLEKKYQKFFNSNGLILCENGYLDYTIPTTKNIFINGYFQSDKYFQNVKDEIINAFTIDNATMENYYPDIVKIRNRNSVCISIKVQHNVGNSIYDVCNDGYWQKAINYCLLYTSYLDGIYFCPHHPDQGYEGEVPELKINCDCRKPKPGMLLKAAKDFNIDLSKSFMIGDSDIDVQAGINAGCKSIKIVEGGLLDAVNKILEENGQ